MSKYGAKRIIFIAFTLVCGAAFIFGLGIFKSADLIDSAFQHHLQSNGINVTALPAPQKRVGEIKYQDVALDDDEKTVIKSLIIKFSPWAWKNIKSIEIDGLFLSGEIDINGSLSIHGIQNISLQRSLISPNIESIRIRNINFSFLSAHFGGIRGISNLTARRKDNALIWTGNIDSRQDQLELISKISAQTNNTGTWVMDMEVENAKLEREWGKFTRTNGGISWNGKNEKWASLKAELNAGGFIAHNTTWQNAAITLDATPQSKKAYIAAKSSGIKGLELGVDALLGVKNIKWNARIHADTGKQLIDYFSAHSMNPLPTALLNIIKNRKDINLQFSPQKNGLIFKINNQSQEIDIKGKIERKSAENISVILTSNKNFKNDLKGVNCEKENICRLKIAYDNKKYSLKE